LSWTEEEYQEFMKQRAKSIHASVKPMRNKSKYHAKRIDKYGRTWDSKKELKEYEQLLILQQAGEVKTIELQPQFELQPGFTHAGKRERAITYKADFKVTYSDGRIEIIECKGFKTRDYVLRRKLLLYKYPDVNFVEIT
jgi:hypothetical protein